MRPGGGVSRRPRASSPPPPPGSIEDRHGATHRGQGRVATLSEGERSVRGRRGGERRTEPDRQSSRARHRRAQRPATAPPPRAMGATEATSAPGSTWLTGCRTRATGRAVTPQHSLSRGAPRVPASAGARPARSTEERQQRRGTAARRTRQSRPSRRRPAGPQTRHGAGPAGPRRHPNPSCSRLFPTTRCRPPTRRQHASRGPPVDRPGALETVATWSRRRGGRRRWRRPLQRQESGPTLGMPHPMTSGPSRRQSRWSPRRARGDPLPRRMPRRATTG